MNSMQFTNEIGKYYLDIVNAVFETIRTMSASEAREEKLDEIYNNLSKRWLELYQESIGKYLAAPQLGLQRELLQKFNGSIGAYHKFMGTGGDFFVMFSKPLKKSMDIIRKTLQDEDQMNAEINSAKDLYEFAKKILEKEYDDWLKSPEGVQRVAAMVERYMEYKQSLNPVRDSWLKSISIPTTAEMEDVYKSIYDLRKTSRQQATVIREQNDTIKKLTAKIRKLEESLAQAKPKKKNY